MSWMSKSVERVIKAHGRTIFYLGKPYFVNLPALRFILKYSDDYIPYEYFGLNVCLADDFTRFPLLPNIEFDGRVCLGAINPLFGGTLDILFDVVLHKFWLNEFTNHFFIVQPQYRDVYIDLFEHNLKQNKVRSIPRNCHFYVDYSR